MLPRAVGGETKEEPPISFECRYLRVAEFGVLLASGGGPSVMRSVDPA